MMTVVDANLFPIIVALLIGLLIGWWMFARRRADAEPGEERILRPGELEIPSARPPRKARSHRVRDGVDTREGRGIADHGAAAAADVAGQMLDVRAHAEMPGASGPPDNLQTLKGVGPKLALRLNENGIFRFDQLASLSHNEIEILDERMGPFRGRIARDRVVEQAAYLARGDRDGFEAQFGKLGGA
jgi:predicted flap endonuclease-1-like 5' DNA nuclease